MNCSYFDTGWIPNRGNTTYFIPQGLPKINYPLFEGPLLRERQHWLPIDDINMLLHYIKKNCLPANLNSIVTESFCATILWMVATTAYLMPIAELFFEAENRTVVPGANSLDKIFDSTVYFTFMCPQAVEWNQESQISIFDQQKKFWKTLERLFSKNSWKHSLHFKLDSRDFPSIFELSHGSIHMVRLLDLRVDNLLKTDSGYPKDADYSNVIWKPKKIPSRKFASKNILRFLSWKSSPATGFTAHSREDETRNGQRNADRNPEWWGEFDQLVKIEKLKFLGISRYRFELRFWLNLNSSVSRGTNSNLFFGFEFEVDSNLPTIYDFDLHFVDHFESHLFGNGLYYAMMCKKRGIFDDQVTLPPPWRMFFHVTYRVIDPQPWRDLLFGMFRFEEAGGRENEKRKKREEKGKRKRKKERTWWIHPTQWYSSNCPKWHSSNCRKYVCMHRERDRERQVHMFTDIHRHHLMPYKGALWLRSHRPLFYT